ncbi:hypothetical protein [Persephonella sp.]
MDIIKKIVVLLAGAVVYIFVFVVAGEIVPQEVLQKMYLPVIVLTAAAGFILSSIVNRFLFGLCPVKSFIFSVISFLLLISAALITVG